MICVFEITKFLGSTLNTNNLIAVFSYFYFCLMFNITVIETLHFFLGGGLFTFEGAMHVLKLTLQNKNYWDLKVFRFIVLNSFKQCF